MAEKKINSLSEVNIDNAKLLTKGYGAADLVDVTFVVESIEVTKGDKSEYLVCKVSGDDIDSKRSFNTGAQNIVEKLKAAALQGKLPIEVTIKKLGGRAFDIV